MWIRVALYLFLPEEGARVIGVDLSEKMLETARKKSAGLDISYLRCAMEDVDFPDNSFDMVFSSLALHYVEDFARLAEKVKRMLKPGGIFLFSCEHPVFTAQGSQDWLYDEKGEIRCFPVDRYYYQGERDAIFLGEHVRKYHRTFTGYLKPLLKLGFTVTDFEEPMPTEEARRTIPGMEDEMRRPMMMIIKQQSQQQFRRKAEVSQKYVHRLNCDKAGPISRLTCGLYGFLQIKLQLLPEAVAGTFHIPGDFG